MNFLNKEQKEQLFWWLVMLSWVPAITAFSFIPPLDFISTTDESTKPLSLLLTQARYWQWHILNPLSLLFLLALFLARELQRPWLMLAALPLLSVSLIPSFNNLDALNGWQFALYALYAASLIVSVISYIRCAHIISAAFVLFAALLVVDSLSLFASDTVEAWVNADVLTGEELEGDAEPLFEWHRSFLGLIYNGYAINLIKTSLFLVCMALLRMAYKLVVDNRDYIRNTNRRQLRLFGLHTMRLWYPMFAIFLFFVLGYHWLFTYKVGPAVVAELHASTEALCAEYDIKDPEICAATGQDLESALAANSAAKVRVVSTEVRKATTDAKNIIDEGVNEAPGKVRAKLHKEIPKRAPGTELQGGCGLNIGCHISDGIKSSANDSYVAQKRKEINKVHRKLSGIAKRASTGLNNAEDLMKDMIGDLASDIERANEVAVKSSFTSFAWLSTLLFIYSLIILIKTFIIVFSRVSFAPQTAQFASFKSYEDKQVAGKLTKLKSHFELSKTDVNTYFFTRYGITISGAPPARKTPNRFMALVSRIWNRRWSMNQVIPAASFTGVEVSVDPPAEFLVWNLEEGEKVFFHFADFVGMSKDLQLKRLVSLSVSTLLFGRMIHYYAQGPGRLFLKTHAQPAISPDKSVSAGHNSAKIVAWNKLTEFDVDASRTKVDTFLSDCNVKPVNPDTDLVVFDLSKTRGASTTAGIMKFAKSFLLPI